MNIPKKAGYIISELQSKGYKAFVVGGCVRDALLGKEPNDWDICTSALPEKTKEVFATHRTVDVGIKHGTIAVIVDGETFEVTTYRSDGEYLDNRRPENVEFVSDIQQDLLRRDFTINAMAYNDTDGLIDICGGKNDLKKGIIRTVGDADTRFNEDALRIMRAIRFSATMGFDIDRKTEKSIFKNRSLLKHIAIERNNVEFTKMILSNTFSPVLKKYKTVVEEFFPIIGNVSDNDIDFAQNLSSVIALRMSAILKNQNYNEAVEELKNMKYPNKVINAVATVLSCFPTKIDNEAQLKRLIGKIGIENCIDVLTLQENEQYIVKAKSITENNQCVSIKDLNVDGNMLIALGFRGETIGKMMDMLLEKVIMGEIQNSREALLNSAKANCYFNINIYEK